MTLDTDAARVARLVVPQDATWWTEARLGLFIHWGLCALPARHEWVKNREQLTDEHHQRYYFDHFHPDLYDPGKWARQAYAAGIRYVVVTTRHHEGFCLWDSDLTDYKVTNTRWGRDLIGPLVDAYRAAGMCIGCYRSLIGWHHREFPVDGLHPQRDDEAFKAAAKGRDIRRYAQYLHGQVRELLTRYGRIDYLFSTSAIRRAPGAAKVQMIGSRRNCWQWSGNCSRPPSSTTGWAFQATC